MNETAFHEQPVSRIEVIKQSVATAFKERYTVAGRMTREQANYTKVLSSLTDVEKKEAIDKIRQSVQGKVTRTIIQDAIIGTVVIGGSILAYKNWDKIISKIQEWSGKSKKADLPQSYWKYRDELHNKLLCKEPTVVVLRTLADDMENNICALFHPGHMKEFYGPVGEVIWMPFGTYGNERGFADESIQAANRFYSNSNEPEALQLKRLLDTTAHLASKFHNDKEKSDFIRESARFMHEGFKGGLKSLGDSILKAGLSMSKTLRPKEQLGVRADTEILKSILDRKYVATYWQYVHEHALKDQDTYRRQLERILAEYPQHPYRRQ